MNTIDIILAWKNEDYRNSLSAVELAALPQHPAGQIELSDAELDTVVGGGFTFPYTKLTMCPKPCEVE